MKSPLNTASKRICLFLSVTSRIPLNAAGVPIRMIHSGISSTYQRGLCILAVRIDPFSIGTQISVNADSAKKMSQRLNETSRSISHMIERHNVCAAIEQPSESSGARNLSVVTIPMGYALVPLRAKDPSFRGKLCPTLLEEGECLNKDSCCDYSHSLDEVRSYNQHYRTKLCEFASNGFCKKGKACRFAHSVEELGTRHHSDTPIKCQSKPSCLSHPIRDSSMLSTEPPTPLNSTGGSADFSFERIPQIPLNVAPIIKDSSESGRYHQPSKVCYKAPPEQRTLSQSFGASHQRVRKPKYHDNFVAYSQRPALIPSSYQYVENLKYIVPTSNDVINTHWQGNSGPFVLTSPHGGSGGYPPGMFYAMPIMYSTRSDSRPTSFALCPQQYVD